MSRLELSSIARANLGDNDERALYRRALAMGATVNATRSLRRGCWKVVVMGGGHVAVLYGQGPLAAVIAGALDDYETVAA